MLVSMEKDNHVKLKNFPIVSVEEADNLMQKSLYDAKSSEPCGMELSNPEFVGLATQEFKIMLNDALQKGKELDHIFSLSTQAKARDP